MDNPSVIVVYDNRQSAFMKDIINWCSQQNPYVSHKNKSTIVDSSVGFSKN